MPIAVQSASCSFVSARRRPPLRAVSRPLLFSCRGGSGRWLFGNGAGPRTVQEYADIFMGCWRSMGTDSTVDALLAEDVAPASKAPEPAAKVKDEPKAEGKPKADSKAKGRAEGEAAATGDDEEDDAPQGNEKAKPVDKKPKADEKPAKLKRRAEAHALALACRAILRHHPGVGTSEPSVTHGRALESHAQSQRPHSNCRCRSDCSALLAALPALH